MEGFMVCKKLFSLKLLFMAIGKKDFCSFVYQFLEIIDVPLNLLELFICNGTLQSFSGILCNMLYYQIIRIASQCLMLAWGIYPRNLLVVTGHETCWGFWVLCLSSGSFARLSDGKRAGQRLPGKGSSPALCPWLGLCWELARLWLWLLCAMNGCFMLTSLQWLFLITNSNMWVLEQCLS